MSQHTSWGPENENKISSKCYPIFCRAQEGPPRSVVCTSKFILTQGIIKLTKKEIEEEKNFYTIDARKQYTPCKKREQYTRKKFSKYAAFRCQRTHLRMAEDLERFVCLNINLEK